MAFQKVQKSELKVVKSASIANTEYDDSLRELTVGEIGFQPVAQNKARGLALILHKAARRLDKHIVIEQTEYSGEYGLSIRLATESEAKAQDIKRDKAMEVSEKKKAEKKVAKVAAPTPMKKTGS